MFENWYNNNDVFKKKSLIFYFLPEHAVQHIRKFWRSASSYYVYTVTFSIKIDQGRNFCFLDLGKDDFHVYRSQCSRFCGCFCCCFSDKREARDFYSEQVDKLTKEFLDEKEKSHKHPVGIVFLTFGSINHAKEVFDSFRRSILQVG